MAFEDLAFKPPVHAIRVKTCGNDWVTDCDTTLTADKVRGFALDSEGVKVYSRERDIHGDYDNIYVPYSNLEALVFYFNEPPKKEKNADCPLVPVPPHGALMDRDDFFAVCPELVDGYKRITDDLVIIPAEEGET